MLIVRKEQMEALDAAMLESFFRRMVVHLRQVFPAETGSLDDAALRTFVRRGVERAKELGITAERDAARFVDLALVLGADSLDRPLPTWIAATLGDRSLGASSRMDALFAEVAGRIPAAGPMVAAWAEVAR